MDLSTKIALLKDEYLLLQKFYEDFDARAVTIKGWSATIGMAAIGVAFYQSRYLWLFAAGSALVFWLMEAVWKSFQYLYAPRIRDIERAFRTNDFSNIAPLQIYTSWFEALRKQGFRIRRNFLLGLVSFPHVITLVAGVALFWLSSTGLIEVTGKQ